MMTIAIVYSCQHTPKQETTTNPETTTDRETKLSPSYHIRHDSIDIQQAQQIALWLNEGQDTIEAFFDRGFEHEYDVYIFSERDSLDKQWQKDWNMPEFKSQCWMVASGIAHRLDILSPRVWQTQACEHDHSDTLESKKLIIHELVHVFHGQNNPSPTFENVENIDWLVEGLAVYVSGQLNEERLNRAKIEATEKGLPTKLADIWKGQNKYGFAGSMVKFIDNKYGRVVLVKLIAYTKASEILDILNISEETLIQEWTRSF